jgi:hypothetical protein
MKRNRIVPTTRRPCRGFTGESLAGKEAISDLKILLIQVITGERLGTLKLRRWFSFDKPQPTLNPLAWVPSALVSSLAGVDPRAPDAPEPPVYILIVHL